MEVELLSITPNIEKLIEKAGRTSYLSFNKQGKNTEKNLIRMLLKKKHYSVLEHAYATFKISGASRAFTHQLVRHRLCSFTQQSQRFVDESSFNYIEPKSIKNNKKSHLIFKISIEHARKAYLNLQKLGITNEDARYVLPNAVESQIVITANLREWRHIIKLRGSSDSQWEIRNVVIKIIELLKNNVPTVFEDFKVNKESNTINIFKEY